MAQEPDWLFWCHTVVSLQFTHISAPLPAEAVDDEMDADFAHLTLGNLTQWKRWKHSSFLRQGSRDDRIVDFHHLILSCSSKMMSVSDSNPVFVEIILSVSENYPKAYCAAQHTFLLCVYFAFGWTWLVEVVTWQVRNMSCLVEHDTCNSLVPCMDDGCRGYRAGKQLAASCLQKVNCSLNANYKHWIPKPKTWPQTLTISPDAEP